MRPLLCCLLLLLQLLLISHSEAAAAPVPKPANKTVDQIFLPDHFEEMFKHRSDPQTHAQGFWDYDSFITAARSFAPNGFASTGGEEVQKRELAAFWAHVAHETTCGYSVARDGPYAWGLCYKEELSPPQLYCQDSFLYPCTLGVSYHGRGALPLYWNYNYGIVGKGLKVDALNNPDLFSQNATLAFQAAIFKWLTPVRPKQPSPHEVMVNKWIPTRNDTLAYRAPGFGMTINIFAGDDECGHGEDPKMSDRIAHYQKFLSIIDQSVDAGKNIDCGTQGVLNPPAPVTSSE